MRSDIEKLHRKKIVSLLIFGQFRIGIHFPALLVVQQFHVLVPTLYNISRGYGTFRHGDTVNRIPQGRIV